ncbi:hypothetical protein IOC61_06935 [Halomonas sp. KAO]|uniref:hypothetical protein n=1 Tax=unclassified Halomonas TaxID=2609666 RepID=UPI00189CC3E2|nr:MULTISPECIES: hypothetical protein [unclassified Halomonas]MBF7053056.1 hypothetical protein [Halomonas sp. KAO]MDT0500644.1 hypothetical protein [Halomonas sp. PAR7]MDT0513165.1 hypothetical protein [Halomonas sp. LES1]MDT0591424.1 hypothetical protein [Halomonas sp. PAR8]
MQTRRYRKMLAPALLAMAIAPLALQASAAPGAGEHAESRQQWQEARAERHAEKRAELFERAGLDAETREALESAHREHREAMAELREEHRERIDELLSDEQRSALDEARREMHEEHHANRHQPSAEDLQHRMRAMVDGWDLSDEERDELRELRQAHYAEMAELRDRDFDSREERREAYQELRDEHRAALAELLTDEQLEEMQQAARMAHGKGHGQGHGHHAGNGND